MFARIFVELAKSDGGKTEEMMIDVAHLKAHRTAASQLKKGLFPGISDAPKGGLNNKLYAIADANERSLKFLMTPG